jgi:hypothetical protein
MKIKHFVEKEVERVFLSIDEPQNISISLNSGLTSDSLNLRLTGEDLKLSTQYCEMIKKNLIEKFG